MSCRLDARVKPLVPALVQSASHLEQFATSAFNVFGIGDAAVIPSAKQTAQQSPTLAKGTSTQITMMDVYP